MLHVRYHAKHMGLLERASTGEELANRDKENEPTGNASQLVDISLPA